MSLKPFWKPSQQIIEQSNIYKMMQRHSFDNYESFWKWSVAHKKQFWEETVNNLEIHFEEKYSDIYDISKGVEQAQWLKDAKLNIVDSCFQNSPEATAIIFQKKGGNIEKITQQELEKLVNKIANSLIKLGLKPKDSVAIYMPMTVEAVAIYLAGIKAGIPIVTIADSFTEKEIAVRLQLTKPKLLFTQDVLIRNNKKLPLYKKAIDANAPKCVVLPAAENNINLRSGDLNWAAFLSTNEHFNSVKQNPEDTINVLFSSGTTGAPKAIPWNHTTPIKSASDGYYYQNIQTNNVVCWPTNLGWMMGPWLVFASLINKATIALYYDSPTSTEFGLFVQNAKVTMLGVVPSIVKQWKSLKCMEQYNWDAIKCFSSTGEVSNKAEMKYLMQLANNKPVIEYCGGTEIGGGYIASTVVQPNIASTFSTQTLGGEFVLLNSKNQKDSKGEVFIVPPIMGLSTKLLNKNHFNVYYKDTPTYKSQVLRRHGDALELLENGYYKALGRVDDAINLGGIKVSSVQIESVVNKIEFIIESAAIGVAPKDGGPNKLIVFYVEKENNHSLEEKLNTVKQHIKTDLNPLFKVSDLIQVEALPRTASNKIMRRKLRDSYENNFL